MSRALKAVGGVDTVQVDLDRHQALVAHHGADLQAMRQAIASAGYNVVGTA